MEIIRELEMRNETVRLDGRHFIDCSFHSCTLEYGGSEVILERTSFVDCHHVFFDHALMTLRYLEAVGVAPWVNVKAIAEMSSAVC